MENARADERRAGNGKNPGPDDAASDAPANGGEAARSADADDRPGDGVRRADGDAEISVHGERNTAGRFCREATEGREFGDALTHGFDDAPTAGHGAAAHGEITADDDPVGNVVRFGVAGGEKSSGDDAHAFLGVVAAMAEAE